MTFTEFIILLIIAAICGATGQALAGYNLGGCLVTIVVGFLGAYIGVWLSAKLGLPEIIVFKIGGEAFPIVWAVAGSALLTLAIALIRSVISGRKKW